MSSVQHDVFLCVLNCAHTKPEHWWLFSGSIVNGRLFVRYIEREEQRDSVLKLALGQILSAAKYMA